ncbi:metal-sensing transcriptional repressor [Adlercreutzia sp. R25]|uniref:metal-sensing transcriptional repressor n=1 Tax=Adlercreutzia shanghongiae TaxID=3111773 RepID=UPI002DB65992|nr:metal-sensing transcriptional repressor [Adlercreutzia sp. R25]MEC4271704.1 metal-sensing transcriptional repressor [Adlercreutzia sp. R25]
METEIERAAIARASKNVVAAGCACRHKHTPRSEELQADVARRLNRAIGQLNGVKAMIEDNRYCGDVLTQLAAAESAVRRVSEMLLQEHMRTCVVEEIRDGNDDVVDEVMTLMHRFL